MVNHNENIREQCKPGELILMYVGNLELYQGIDLMIESFNIACYTITDMEIRLVIIGGKDSDISKYELKTNNLDIGAKVLFLGRRSVENLGHFLSQADILLSPRIKGRNTPMKLYSYLDSGKPVLATNLPTHNWVLSNSIAVLKDPNPDSFAEGMVYLATHPQVRRDLAASAKLVVEQQHSFSAYQRRLNNLYDSLQLELKNSTTRSQ